MGVPSHHTNMAFYSALTQLALAEPTNFHNFGELANYFQGRGLYKARRKGWAEFTDVLAAQFVSGDDGSSYSCNTIDGNGDEEFTKFCDTLMEAMSTSLRSSFASNIMNNVQGFSGISNFNQIIDFFEQYAHRTYYQCRRGRIHCDTESYREKINHVMAQDLFESGSYSCSCARMLDYSCALAFDENMAECQELQELARRNFPSGLSMREDGIVENEGMFDFETIMSMPTDQLFADIEEYTKGNIPWHYEEIDTIAGTRQTRPTMMDEIRKGKYAAGKFQDCQDSMASVVPDDLSSVEKVKENFEKFRSFLDCIRSINPDDFE